MHIYEFVARRRQALLLLCNTICAYMRRRLPIVPPLCMGRTYFNPRPLFVFPPPVSIFYATAPSTAAMISAAAYSAVSPKRDGLRAYALRASLSRSLSKNTGTELKPLAADCLTCAHSTRNRLHWKRRYSSNTMITGTTTNWYTFLSLKTENGVRVSVQVNRRNRFVNIA